MFEGASSSPGRGNPTLLRSTMPRRRKVCSLQSLCLEAVARNMLHAADEHGLGKDLHQPRAPCTEGPFTELAGALVHELLQLMGEIHSLSRTLLHWLLVPQLTELNLSICPELVGKDIAQTIAGRCTHLSRLDLQECNEVPAEALADMVKHLPGLTKLDLSDTQCDAQVLSAVGSCCRRLRDLDISGCDRLSPEALLHLAYDRARGSFCCPALQRLLVAGQNTVPPGSGERWSTALAFVLLALPSLRSVVHDHIGEALCLIHWQVFEGAWAAPGFPSLEELVHSRRPTCSGAIARFTLPLREVFLKSDAFLPLVGALCPGLTVVTVLQSSSLAQSCFSLRHLTHLTLILDGSRDLRELLPVATSLGAQLEYLSFSGFSFEEKLSFHTLLSYCLALRKLSASLLPPVRNGSADDGRHVEDQRLSLTPLRFPHLSDLFLLPSDPDDPLPPQHAAVLKASLTSLLKHSPCLENVELICLPFPLDEVFEEVLGPPGAALAHLDELFLLCSQVSVSTIQRLLSSDNQLSFLSLENCPSISKTDYEELLRTVDREGFVLRILWQ